MTTEIAEMVTVKVTLTLPRPGAERLRGMCHAMGMTASLVVERWVSEHNDQGVPRRHVADLFGDVIRKVLDPAAARSR